MCKPRVVFDLGGYGLGDDVITGIGLRFAEFALALSNACEVTVYGAQPPAWLADRVHHVDTATQWAHVLKNTDVVLFTDDVDLDHFYTTLATGCLIVSEISPPLEHLDYPSLRRGAPGRALRRSQMSFREQARFSDHIIVRSSVERTTMLGALGALGVLKPTDLATSRLLAHRLTLVPIGFTGPVNAGATGVWTTAPRWDLVWSGGLWSFYDPFVLIEAIALGRRHGLAPVTTAFLHASNHPDTAVTIAELKARVDALGLGDAVAFVTEPMPQDLRDRVVTQARATVALGRPGIENETCVRLRVRDNRRFGIPLLVDGHGATARELSADGLAVVADDLSPEGVLDAIEQVMARPPASSQTLEQYDYQRTLAPFIEWIRRAVHDKQSSTEGEPL